MFSTVLAVILLGCVLTFSAAQTSCRGRCGAEYYRGYICQCDYNCLQYGECCKDYESQCTTKNSCKGRCGETFKRGRLCSCDSNCMNYKQCCPDYSSHCDAEDDHLIPLVNPTSYPPDDLSDDMYISNEIKDPGASPVPEGTSGYGLSTVDLLDPVFNEPTLNPDTVEPRTEKTTVFSQTETSPSDTKPTQADDRPFTPEMTSGASPTESTDASDFVTSTNPGTAVPQPTSSSDHVSNQSTPTSAPQTESTTSAAGLESLGEAEVQPEDDILPEAQTTDATEASSDKPEVTTLSLNASNPAETSVSNEPTLNPESSAESTPASTMPTSSTLDLGPIPEETTSNPETDVTEKTAEHATTGPASDLSPGVSPVQPENSPKPEVLPTHIPSSTVTDETDNATPQVTTTDLVQVISDITKPQPSKPDLYKPSPTKPIQPAKPTEKPQTKPLDTSLNTDDPRNYQADDSNDTNLCSGRPVSAVTTLRNGTIVVFRGHYFWFLDRNRVPGPPRGITQVWGIPSPIDTAFTRCNCQGKTYIFKGAQYWRYENDVLDPGYPKVIQTGFDGLQGHITAALSAPQYRRRKESVYFFKRGGTVQKYSYQFGTSPTCGRKVQYAIYTAHNRVARQAVSVLEPAINIRTSWKGFPSTITSAVSVPNNREPEGYKYYVFSRSKSYNVRMDGERPAIAASKANTSPQSNDFFKCPKKV